MANSEKCDGAEETACCLKKKRRTGTRIRGGGGRVEGRKTEKEN